MPFLEKKISKFSVSHKMLRCTGGGGDLRKSQFLTKSCSYTNEGGLRPQWVKNLTQVCRGFEKYFFYPKKVTTCHP